MLDRSFWERQRVLLTGHTGFKGSWASLWLERLGATVTGYALPPDHKPDLFSKLAPFDRARSVLGDLSDAERLAQLFSNFQPTLVLHMAAQPLVRASYGEPVKTFASNVMGTVNVLEAARSAKGVQAILVVTTDKVYHNQEHDVAFKEDDRLGGYDPYSASKAAAELVTASYAKSFLEPAGVAVATARAGNVIGGGDWSEDRLVPDMWRALHAGVPIELRYPGATRPWQHVLESISGYLSYLQQLAREPAGLAKALNFGPSLDEEPITVADVAEALGQEFGAQHAWVQAAGDHRREMQTLALDSGLATEQLGWRPRLSARDALAWTAEWYRKFDCGGDARQITASQIQTYESLT